MRMAAGRGGRAAVDMVLEMRKAVKQADPDATLLGEVWEDASNKTAYGVNRSYCLGDMLDSVMNYPLRCAVIDFFTGVIDAYQLRRVILHQQEVYPAPLLLFADEPAGQP